MPYTTESMSHLNHKSLISNPHNLTYSYYLSPNFHSHRNSKPSAPTLLFIHGYPDDAYMWAGILPVFLERGYRFLVLDLLGFAGSSKPTDTKLYNYKQQAASITQVLDGERVEGDVVPIGHDWGSATAQRFYLYHRERCVGLVLLSLAYQIPSSQKFDLNQANEMTAKRFGYPQWEYWNFFCRPDAPGLMRENIGRFYEVMHGFHPDEKGRDVWMMEMFCTPNAMYEYVTQTGAWKDRRVELKPYAKDLELFGRFKERMCRDGFEGPVQYYFSLKDNTMLDEEKELAEMEGGRAIDVPILYIGETGDWVCRTDLMGDAKEEGLLKRDLEERVVEAGHWVLYEKPEEVAEIIGEWVGRRFPTKE